MLDNLGGRKFVGFVIVAVMLFALVFFSKVTGTEFVAFITANLGIYVVGNVSATVANKSSDSDNME